MKLIAHRGLLYGPDKSIENSPKLITETLSLGYQCEIDVWKIKDTWYLGHDEPQYKTNISFLNNQKFWVHAKNIEALYSLADTTINYFWHETDQFTITSSKYIWTCDITNLTDKSVVVLLENPKSIQFTCFGICSDYSIDINNLLLK